MNIDAIRDHRYPIRAASVEEVEAWQKYQQRRREDKLAADVPPPTAKEEQK